MAVAVAVAALRVILNRQNKLPQDTAMAMMICKFSQPWSNIAHCLSTDQRNHLIWNLCQALQTVRTRPCKHRVHKLKQGAHAVISGSKVCVGSLTMLGGSLRRVSGKELRRVFVSAT